jgi:MFS family permease
LVNSLSLSVQSGKGIDQTVVEMSTVIENILAGVFALVGGLLSDILGRKRMAITGFVMLGLGYAILGIYPANLVAWYLYTAVDGISWGIFYAVFFMTVWGDLAFGASSVKYYALGGLPYLFSNFLGIVLEPYIAEVIPAYAIFSFTAFFLFLAVIPLMYAPETLPEKNIRDRELKTYVDTAIKIKEKSISKT